MKSWTLSKVVEVLYAMLGLAITIVSTMAAFVFFINLGIFLIIKLNETLDFPPVLIGLLSFAWSLVVVVRLLPIIILKIGELTWQGRKKDPLATLEEEELKLLYTFLPQAVRSLEWWKLTYKEDPNVPFRLALLRHLFVKNTRIPPYFEEEVKWVLRQAEVNRYVFLAKGGDIKNLPGLSIPLTRKMLAILGKTSPFFTFNLAVLRAEILGLSGGEKLWKGIDMANTLGHIRKPENYKFWREVWVYLIRNPEQEGAIYIQLISYIQALKFGNPIPDFENMEENLTLPLKPNFCIKGRNFDKLKEEAFGWYRKNLNLDACTLAEWAEAIKPFSVIFEGVHYEINPLATKEAILNEAEFMGHCVADYVGDCLQGDTSIWSMTTSEPGGIPEKTLTIEVEKTMILTEVQGFENRDPLETEMKVILRWAKENDIANYLE